MLRILASTVRLSQQIADWSKDPHYARIFKEQELRINLLMKNPQVKFQSHPLNDLLVIETKKLPCYL